MRLLALLLASVAFGADYYVSTSGSGTTCSIGSPCAITYVCAGLGSNPRGLTAGDTVHLRAGTYTTAVGIICEATGSAGNPVTFQPYTGENVTVDMTGWTAGEPLNAIWATSPFAAYIRVRSNPSGGTLHLTSTDTRRQFSDSSVDPEHEDFCYATCRPPGFSGYGDHTELREVIISNAGDGIGTQQGDCGGVYVGNLIYYGGWDSVSVLKNIGNTMYIQNGSTCGSTRKLVEGNVSFGNYLGTQIYGSNGTYIRNIDFINNVALNDGHTGGSSGTWNGLVGKTTAGDVNDNVLTGNYWLNTLVTSGHNSFRFYTHPCTNCTYSNNYVRSVAGSNALSLTFSLTGLTETGNIFAGSITDGSAAAQFPNSTFLASETTDRVFKPTNSRALVVIDGNDDQSVSWTPTGCSAGQSWELREVMEYNKTTPDTTLACGEGAKTISTSYSGGILSPSGTLPAGPTHSGNKVRVFWTTLVTGSAAKTGISGRGTAAGRVTIQ